MEASIKAFIKVYHDRAKLLGDALSDESKIRAYLAPFTSEQIKERTKGLKEEVKEIKATLPSASKETAIQSFIKAYHERANLLGDASPTESRVRAYLDPMTIAQIREITKATKEESKDIKDRKEEEERVKAALATQELYLKDLEDIYGKEEVDKFRLIISKDEYKSLKQILDENKVLLNKLNEEDAKSKAALDLAFQDENKIMNSLLPEEINELIGPKLSEAEIDDIFSKDLGDFKLLDIPSRDARMQDNIMTHVPFEGTMPEKDITKPRPKLPGISFDIPSSLQGSDCKTVATCHEAAVRKILKLRNKINKATGTSKVKYEDLSIQYKDFNIEQLQYIIDGLTKDVATRIGFKVKPPPSSPTVEKPKKGGLSFNIAKPNNQMPAGPSPT